ncbi:MAG TPA: hypothetical protein PK156_15725 [Polyangium sp.]|nr:hypothetical protein [Polyangium sp.]
MGTTNARTNTRWLIGVFGAGVFALGCGHAASAPRTGARLPSEGQRHRLDFRVNAHLPACDDRDSFREQLSPEVQGTIGPEGERLLRVAIDRYHENEKRIFVELVDEQGQVVERVDQAVGGAHMDCGRVLRLAAGFASTMVGNTFSRRNEAASAPEPLPPNRDRRSAEAPRKVEPRQYDQREDAPEQEDETDDSREQESRMRKPRRHERRKGWNDEPYESDPEPGRRTYRVARPDPEVICPPVATSAPSQPERTVPVVQNFYDGKPEKEDKGEQADPFAGGHFLFGVGALRGPDSRLNLGGRIGAGYVTSSGKFAIEIDATGAGAIPGFVNNRNYDYSTLLLGANVGLCGRSSSLGLCIVGSGMIDGYKPTVPNGSWWTGKAAGVGTRAWVDISSGETWTVRANIEMTLPVYVADEESKDPRIFATAVPVGGLFLTFVYSKKPDAGKDKGDEKKK